MEIVLTILRIICLLISNIGLWELLRDKTKIDKEFLPSITAAAQTCLLFIAGILNLLPYTAAAVFAAGAIYFIFRLKAEKGIGVLKCYADVSYAYLAIVTTLIGIAVHGQIFTHYDDLSHWALVVQKMLDANRFPNFLDTSMMFQEYPLGSSIFIYYFSRVVGSSESVMMLAQVYLTAACIMPIFSFCKRYRIPALLVMLSFTNFVLIYNIRVQSLLVDTLLPVASVCMLLYVYKYCTVAEDTPEFYLGGAYLIQVAQIKNSGVLFVLIAAAWVIYKAAAERKYKQRVILMLLPLISFIIWHAHCRYVFPKAEISKHAMTPRYYYKMIVGKSSDTVKNIVTDFFRFLISFNGTYVVLALIIVTGVLTFVFCREKKPLWIKTSVFSAVLFIVYQFGLIGMYLFSMPETEASYLAGCERYEKTVIIAILYVMMIMLMKILSDLEAKKLAAGVLTAVMFAIPFLIMIAASGKIMIAGSASDDSAERVWMETKRDEYSIPYGSSCCLLIPEKDSSYSLFLGRYVFHTDDIDVRIVEGPEELEDISADYVVVYDSNNELISDWIRTNYPEQAGKDIIAIGER